MSERKRFRMTYRVEQIPQNWTADRLSEAFSPEDRELLSIKSLVPDVMNYGGGAGQSNTMTATIDFYSQEARKPMLSDPENTDLVLGKDFLGCTPLNHPRGECVADVIAVTGLAGHAFGSWRHEDGKMWLRDLLPEDLPAVRVMIYGYSAQVQGATQATSILEDHAETFRQRLLSFRRFEACQKRPLILIGHSLGGLVIKEFIANLDESQRSQFSIRSVLFFGVPHHGLVHESLQTMVKGQPSSTIVDQLKPGSPTLRKLDAAFCKATVLTHFSIHTFYENQETRTVVENEARKWVREGAPVKMVSYDSAVLKLPSIESIHEVQGNHSSMVKIIRSQSYCYYDVVQCIEEALQGTSGSFPSTRPASSSRDMQNGRFLQQAIGDRSDSKSGSDVFASNLELPSSTDMLPPPTDTPQWKEPFSYLPSHMNSLDLARTFERPQSSQELSCSLNSLNLAPDQVSLSAQGPRSFQELLSSSKSPVSVPNEAQMQSQEPQQMGPFSPVFDRGNFPHMTTSLDQPNTHRKQIGERASLPHSIVCPLGLTSVIPIPVNLTCDFCGQSIADARWIHCLVCLDICLHMHCHQPATEMKGHVHKVFTARGPILTSQTTGLLPEPGFNPSCMTGHLISSKRQMYCFLVKDIPRAKYRVILTITIRFLLPGRVSSYDATIRACMGDPKSFQDFGGSSLRSYGPDIPVESLFRVAFPLTRKHQVRLDGEQNLDHYSFDRGSEGNEFLISNPNGDLAVAIELSGFPEAHMQDGPSQPAFDLAIDGLNLIPVAEDRDSQRTSITKNLSGMVRKILS